MTIKLSLILQTTRIQKPFPLFVFVFVDSLVVSALQDAGGYAISRQNNLELNLGCHTCRLNYFTLVCLWCTPTDCRTYCHVLTKISRMGRLPHFLTHGAPLRALHPRELRQKKRLCGFRVHNTRNILVFNVEKFRLQNNPFFCVFKYARAVKQKVWNETENREPDWGETLKIRFFFFLSPHTPVGRVRLARKTYATLYRFLY